MKAAYFFWQNLASNDSRYFFLYFDSMSGELYLLDADFNTEYMVEYIENLSLSSDWVHFTIRVDTTQPNESSRVRVYLGPNLLSAPSYEWAIGNSELFMFVEGSHLDFGAGLDVGYFTPGKIAFLTVVSGQSLGPDAFAFDNNGVWTHKPFSGNVGSFGLILDGSDGFNDVSGNGHHFGAFNGVQLDQNDLPPFI